MSKSDSGFSRRYFLETSGAAAAASLLPWGARADVILGPPRYTRWNATSPKGQQALKSYAKAIEIMLKLPASDPHNWFRNTFVHFMDCPHGNWWFYVWHRGYLGFFEKTVRMLSGDPEFAFPYWDWTQLPQIPGQMFDGVLTPNDMAFAPYTGNLAKFTSFIQPAMQTYWNSLSAAQLTQLKARGYTQFDQVWYDVQGAVPNPDPKKIYAVAGNMAFAPTCGARYLTRDNPKLDANTTYDVSPFVVTSGLLADQFYNDDATQSFNSSKTPSHNTQPSGSTKFSTLEGMPHNKTHNYIGGYGPLNFGPYGNMTNNLSPVDPIFFLHHSNMDRLWDVWTRKQLSYHLDAGPSQADAKTYYNEPFLFYVDANRKPVSVKAAEVFTMHAFDYGYEPGFGEDVIRKPTAMAVASGARPAPVQGVVRGNSGTLDVATKTLTDHLASNTGASLVAVVTIPRPEGNDGGREFDVLINAPDNVTSAGPGSPYYAGTVAFFGHMANMAMPMDASFAVPLPKTPQVAANLKAGAPGNRAAAPAQTTISIRVVPANGGTIPELKAVTLGVRQ